MKVTISVYCNTCKSKALSDSYLARLKVLAEHIKGQRRKGLEMEAKNSTVSG